MKLEKKHYYWIGGIIIILILIYIFRKNIFGESDSASRIADRSTSGTRGPSYLRSSCSFWDKLFGNKVEGVGTCRFTWGE